MFDVSYLLFVTMTAAHILSDVASYAEMIVWCDMMCRAWNRAYLFNTTQNQYTAQYKYSDVYQTVNELYLNLIATSNYHSHTRTHTHTHTRTHTHTQTLFI